MTTATDTAPQATRRVPALALAALAGPVSFGITGPALVLGDIARDLDVTILAATSVVTAFGWGIAVGTPLTGAMLARRGPRGALLVFALLIAAGAGLVLAVPVLAALVVGAGLQALGGAGMIVVAMSLADNARAMGAATSALAVVGAVAPLIGTQVEAALSWQAVLAMTVLSLVAVPFVLRRAEPRPSVSEPFDALGALLLTGLVTALVFLPQHPLPAAGGAVAAAALLALHVRRVPEGFLPKAVLAARRFTISAGLALLLAVVNFGLVYAAPPRLADLTGWNAGELGIALVVPYLTGGALSWFLVARSGRLRYPMLVAVLIGAVVTALAAAVFGATALPILFAGMTTGSIAASTGQGALALHAGAAVPESRRATAMGLFNLCYLLGAAFGPAIAAIAAG